MYKIVSSASQLIIDSGRDHIVLDKPNVTGINKRGPLVNFIGSDSGRLYGLDWTNGVIIDGVTQTSSVMCEATLRGLLQTGILQSFIAAPAQDTFTPAFTANTLSRVYVQQMRVVSGWSIVAGAVVFAVPMVGGEEVLIEKLT
jgi:hypothetical protein